ncbi:G2/mitotic-specific cyclin-B3-like [Anopheles albimanus]|uniref:Uncharacterized protein n=1 Tax=Anopheles albimanus TaxID=7167 RepID=A0A182FLX5_ANOAL|nr:G2/mitotic-specific cyclin-B3-like [Anopheles albimanus]XP_035790400.1 G2/mitotic-specific cyclin-B3-like [Anopheles albimanus]XP_035790401.1 G2/mitotic-specific cyclin-B3-like [Anopheles albimanus]
MPLTNQPSNTAADVKPLGRLATRYRAAMEKQGLVKGVVGGMVDQQQHAGTMKRKADISPLKHEHGTKRLALGNLTNAEASSSNIASGTTGGGFLKNKTINKLQKPLSQMVQQLTIRNRSNCDGKKQSSKVDTQSHMYTKPDVNGPEIKGATKILTRAAMRQQQQQQQQTQKTLDHGAAKENMLPSGKISSSTTVTASEPNLPAPLAPKMAKALDTKRTNVAMSPAKLEPSKKRSEKLSSPSGKNTSGGPTVAVAGGTTNKVKTRLSSEFESDNSLYVTALDFSNEDTTGGAGRASEAASNARALAAMAKEANAQTKKVTAKVIVITEGPPAGNRKHLDKPDVLGSEKAELTVAESSPEKEKQTDAAVVDSSPRKRTPADVEDFDQANWNDIYQVSNYAQDIFEYLRERESSYTIPDYMERQPYVTKWMRAVLVDWMVEIQESFELNHETLYLGVKIVDMYLSLVVIQRERLQLVAAAALLIAAKYDERIPPTLDDFIYICDGAYDRPELMKMERTVFRTIGYDLGIPLSYRFLRRYARVNRVPMPILTLARYILETSLMEYNTVLMLDSKLACAALFIALRMNNKPGWNPTLEFYSGYKIADFKDVVITLNMCMMQPKSTLHTVRQKYSHELFYGVAKCPIIPNLEKLFDGAVPAEGAVFKMPAAISTTTGGVGSCGQREQSKKGGD